MTINYDALAALQLRQERFFPRHFTVSNRYVQGETWFVDDALVAGKYKDDMYAMVIGEAPGGTEDIKGRPFVGKAGILLRQLLESVSLPPAWITNVVKFRPLSPGNRTPTDEEIEAAKPYLRAEWEAIGKPRTVICCGNTPLKAVTGSAGVLKRAGKMEMWPASDGGLVYLWPMVHPSFANRNPAVIPQVEQHWRVLSEWLDATYN